MLGVFVIVISCAQLSVKDGSGVPEWVMAEIFPGLWMMPLRETVLRYCYGQRVHPRERLALRNLTKLEKEYMDVYSVRTRERR